MFIANKFRTHLMMFIVLIKISAKFARIYFYTKINSYLNQ